MREVRHGVVEATTALYSLGESACGLSDVAVVTLLGKKQERSVERNPGIEHNAQGLKKECFVGHTSCNLANSRRILGRLVGGSRGEGGATLVESLIAITVLTLAISFVVSLIPSGALSQRRAERRVWAGNRADSFLAEQSLSAGTFMPRTEIGRESHENVAYRLYLTVSQVTSSGGAPLNTEIARRWQARTGSVVVVFDAVRNGDGSAVVSRRFEARVAVAEPEAGFVGPALNRAANQVAGEVAEWIG